MQTCYVRFVQKHDDEVWGTQALPWIHTGLVRVTRNRLRKAVFEWVGRESVPFDLERIQRSYPIAIYADLQDSGSYIHAYRKRSPIPG